jgi:hypothetical protein
MSQAGALCSAKGATAIAEKLSLGQALGQGGAVDREESALASAPGVDGASHDLFARPGFTFEHDGQVTLGGAQDWFDRRPQLGPAEQARRDGSECKRHGVVAQGGRCGRFPRGSERLPHLEAPFRSLSRAPKLCVDSTATSRGHRSKDRAIARPSQ